MDNPGEELNRWSSGPLYALLDHTAGVFGSLCSKHTPAGVTLLPG